MSTAELERAQEQLAKAEARAAAARDAAENAAAIDAARRAERERRFDGATFACYDERQLDAAVADAERRLEKALEANPLTAAAVALRQAKKARSLAGEVRAGIASRLYGEAPTYAMAPTDVLVGTIVERYVEKRGSDLAHAEVEGWWTAREQAADE